MGPADAVEVLLNHGAQTFTQRDSRATPLHDAAKHDRIEILKRLLTADDAGKCLEHKNNTGDTPLWLALYHSHPKCAEILVNNGASLYVANNDGATVLHVAVSRDLYDFVKKNIRQFSPDEIESRNRWNDTPLVLAQRGGKHGIVELLTHRRDRA